MSKKQKLALAFSLYRKVLKIFCKRKPRVEVEIEKGKWANELGG